MNNCNSTGEWIGIGLADVGLTVGIVGLIIVSVWGIISRPETKTWVIIGIAGTIIGIASLFFIGGIK